MNIRSFNYPNMINLFVNIESEKLGFYFSFFLHLIFLIFVIGLPNFFKSSPINIPTVIPIEILTVAETTSAIWNDTSPTATLFSVSDGAGINSSSNAYIAYCFHSVDGYSKVGSYVGNGDDDGTFVYLGFRPAFTQVKRTDVAEDWWLEDDKRNTYNPQSKLLYADENNAEATEINKDYVSNGMKMRLNNANWNASGGTYLYYACAAYPFKYSNAR